ncbi:MAG TPA: TIM-barrel domain-containing protein [Bacteroidales bacterium]|nr:TIM-barrel domain-containing protein [Bacteroidales bacterium]
MKKLLFLSAAALLFISCSQTTWEKTDNGVVVRLNSKNTGVPKLMKLEVITDEIIHVIAAPVNKLSDEKSLCVIDGSSTFPDFAVRQVIDTLILSTSGLKAKVLLASGQILFCDENDRIILKERHGGGKSFAPVSVEGMNGFSTGQIFESPDNEAFYGLGQHQSEEFNYKGLNESLYQYNTKVSVPFVVSNRNYGILWDNYSLTKFGDPRDYSQLDIFNLSDKNGEPGALTATYFNSSDSTDIFIERKEPVLDYENLTTVKNLPEGVDLGRSSVIWSGKMEPKESGIYHFKLYYAGYTKLYIDDELIVPERWRTAWNPNTYKFTRNMEKGKQYSIKLEWKPDGGVSYIGLKALSPRTPEEKGSLSLTSEMGNQIDYYFIHGNSMDEVISGYRTITGKAPIMPKWSFGYWQSRERYRSQSELIDVVKEYRKRNIPLDNIVLDWSYWPVDSWGSHEFDPKFFPEPDSMVDEVHSLNAKIMISVWPKFYITTDHYKEFDSKGWMYTQAVKDSVRDWIGRGYIGSFYDAYSQGARDLFWEQIREHLYSKGFDAWWMDASEPDILSNASIGYRKALSTPTALGPSTKYFNTYALVNAMAIYNGQRSADPDKRVFLLTRSGFAGLQRYSTATWSGDIGTRWEDLKAQIPAGLNYAMSGIPYWTMDIGGFCVENRYVRAEEGSDDRDEWRELNTRWYQFGSFCPLFRSHGQYPFREVYNISPEDHPAYKSMLYYDKLRYHLMPYIYSLAGLTYFNDYTIMRAMVMDFSKDKEVVSIGDQYMFGPSILVAPVYKYQVRAREVYFPSSCGWYDFYSGNYIIGGKRAMADAPYERMPLFIREGSIIPIGPEIQFTDEKPADPLTLYVYTGRNCAFTLYEDEGTNYNYENGACSTIKFTFNNETGELAIGDRNGSYDGMLNERTFNIIWVSKDNPIGFEPGRPADLTVRYNGRKIVVKEK